MVCSDVVPPRSDPWLNSGGFRLPLRDHLREGVDIDINRAVRFADLMLKEAEQPAD